jgi:hypothetical protein
MELVTPADALRRSFVAYSLGDGVAGPAAGLALYVLPFFALVGFASLAIGRRWQWIGLLLCVGILPLAAVVIGEMTGRPLFHERYLIVITPAIAALAGYGLAAISRTTIGRVVSWTALGALSVVTLSAYYAPPAPRAIDYRATAALILDQARPLAVVVISPPQGPGVNYYLRDRLPTYTGHGEASRDDVSSALAALVAGHREAWFVRYSSGAWDDPIGNWLEANAFYEGDRWITQNHVEMYALPPPTGMMDRKVSSTVADTIVLTGLRSGPSQLKPGDAELVGISWKTPNPEGNVARGAKVSIRLIDSTGRRVAMLDRSLLNPSGLANPDANGLWNVALMVPPEAAPGRYRLEARFYDGSNGKGWTVRDGEGSEQDALDLGEAEVG